MPSSHSEEDEQYRILSTQFSNEVVKTARLQEENARLKKLLFKEDRGTTPLEAASSTNDATVSAEEYRQMTEKYDELHKKFQESSLKIKYLERKNIAVMQKNREMKASVKAWQAFCDRHIGKRKPKTEKDSAKAEQSPSAVVETHEPRPRLPASPGSTTARTPGSLVDQERSSPTPMVPLPPQTVNPEASHGTVPGVRDRLTSSPPLESVLRIMDVSPGDNSDEQPIPSLGSKRDGVLYNSGSERLGSSQTTEDEIADRNANMTADQHNLADDDDVPQVVSSRCLKRKRKASTGFKVYNDRSDGTPARPVRIKEEQFSSPPPESTTRKLLQEETLDLDEIKPKIIGTPRRRMVRGSSVHSNPIEALQQQQRANSMPFSNPMIKPEPIQELSERESRLELDVFVGEEDSGVLSDPEGLAQGPVEQPINVLRPISGNVMMNRANEGAPSKRIKKEELRERSKFNMLTESKEAPPPLKKRKQLAPSLARERFNERIRATKALQSPAKTAVTTPKSAPSKTCITQVPTPPSSSSKQPYTPSARQRPVPATEPKDTRPPVIPDGRPVWRMDLSTEPSRKSPVKRAPSEEPVPLRSKPPSELSIQDFKLNPKYNQGYTHAFSETVRKRSDRLCLPGCTDPKCCGSTFRTLASAAAPLSASQEEELLQEYLGDAYDGFGLTHMDQEEKSEIVLQARTRQMAMQHGKHRQAFEGRSTPPGFWRVDFPTTQEQQEDLEKAVQMQREKVRERWLEAHRTGGKWMFRDE